jgi:hypothetical protein
MKIHASIVRSPPTSPSIAASAQIAQHDRKRIVAEEFEKTPKGQSLFSLLKRSPLTLLKSLVTGTFFPLQELAGFGRLTLLD